MSDPIYARILAEAAALPPNDQLRLIADLAAGLATPAPAATLAAAAAVAPIEEAAPATPDIPLSIFARPGSPPAQVMRSNGIDALTGRPPLTIDAAAALQAEVAHEKGQRELLQRQRENSQAANFGTIYTVSMEDLREAQWAIVVSADDSAELIKSLSPLIKRRCAEMGFSCPPLEIRSGETCGAWLRRVVGDANLLKPMSGTPKVPVFVYTPPQNATNWLAARNISIDVVDPARGVPFYLMLVGRPGPLRQGDQAYIPYSFQYDMDLYWGVGRLCFTNPDGSHDFAAYERYAERTAGFEDRPASYDRHIAYFATNHGGNDSTVDSDTGLTLPLAEKLNPWALARHGFSASLLRGPSAKRDDLAHVLRGQADGKRPAVLFSATHGIKWIRSDPDLPLLQGALVCQDWDTNGGPRREQDLFGGEQLDAMAADLKIEGMLAFCFACYGVGSPRNDLYTFAPGAPPTQIAPYDLVARMPQRLLNHGALAVIGHVDRAWTSSFSDTDRKVTAQYQAFYDVLSRLVGGQRMGMATDQFNTRSAVAGNKLAELLADYEAGAIVDIILNEISPIWQAYHDARSYAVLGDPAARLHFQAAAPV